MRGWIVVFVLGCTGRPEVSVDSAVSDAWAIDSADVGPDDAEGSPIEDVDGAEYLHLPLLFIDCAVVFCLFCFLLFSK